jgi:hypothetical protein
MGVGTFEINRLAKVLLTFFNVAKKPRSGGEAPCGMVFG